MIYTKYKKEQLESIVKFSKSWNEVCVKLGLLPKGGSQSYIKKIAVQFEIDFTHFPGQSHNKGKTSSKRTTAEDYLKSSQSVTSHRLKSKLIRDGLKKEKCELCGLSEWYGEKLPVELDHKDGDHSNNELNNLQILCPNCHSIKTRKERKNLSIATKNVQYLSQ